MHFLFTDIHFFSKKQEANNQYCYGGVMVRVLASSVVELHG